MSNKLHIVVHTVNGTVDKVYDSWHEDLVVKKLPNDIISSCDFKELIHYGNFKKHEGNTRHCFYYTCIYKI